jgi:hypothetical protein
MTVKTPYFLTDPLFFYDRIEVTAHQASKLVEDFLSDITISALFDLCSAYGPT